VKRYERGRNSVEDSKIAKRKASKYKGTNNKSKREEKRVQSRVWVDCDSREGRGRGKCGGIESGSR
jgi:hypothetical protein